MPLTVSRRKFLLSTGLTTAGTLFGRAPAIITAAGARPSNAFGVRAGDVDAGRAIIQSRTDRAARLIVEYATTESFRDPKRIVGPAMLENTDFTARVDLDSLPPGQRIFYRVTFDSLEDPGTLSDPLTGTFMTAPDAAHPRDVTVAWTGDVVGQGWGINPDDGGLRLFETMR
jgi:alkaline phosphatase D